MFSCLKQWMPADPTYYLRQCSSFLTSVAKNTLPGQLLISSALYYKKLAVAGSKTPNNSLLITQENIKEQVKALYPHCILSLGIESALEAHSSGKDLNPFPKKLARKSLEPKYMTATVAPVTTMVHHYLNYVKRAEQLYGYPTHLYASTPAASPLHNLPRRLGDKFSPFTPTVTITLPLIRLKDVAGEKKLNPSIVNRIARDSFALQHELATIAQGKDSICLALNFSMGLLNLGLWAYGLSGTAPLVTQLISTTIKVASFHAAGNFFIFNYLKNKVLRADTAALNALKCSSPAHGLLFGLKEDPHNLSMPSKAARLANVIHWESHHFKSPS